MRIARAYTLLFVMLALVPASGPPLGVETHPTYTADTLTLAVDDLLFIYTDGVNEAMDRDANLFGYDQLHTTISQGGKQSTHVVTAVKNAIQNFTMGHPQSDDICMVCFRRKQ